MPAPRPRHARASVLFPLPSPSNLPATGSVYGQMFLQRERRTSARPFGRLHTRYTSAPRAARPPPPGARPGRADATYLPPLHKGGTARDASRTPPERVRSFKLYRVGRIRGARKDCKKKDCGGTTSAAPQAFEPGKKQEDVELRCRSRRTGTNGSGHVPD
eukprot:gene11868-biopygen10944